MAGQVPEELIQSLGPPVDRCLARARADHGHAQAIAATASLQQLRLFADSESRSQAAHRAPVSEDDRRHHAWAGIRPYVRHQASQQWTEKRPGQHQGVCLLGGRSEQQTRLRSLRRPGPQLVDHTRILGDSNQHRRQLHTEQQLLGGSDDVHAAIRELNFAAVRVSIPSQQFELTLGELACILKISLGQFDLKVTKLCQQITVLSCGFTHRVHRRVCLA
ncbi:hypothetical protein OG225_40945 (plasmid) [Nocardia sp. NBC_01377]|uniref:hypothetical protein n=1 Tax=Nocardia sp. NBC_01377 TaxID=2903595 RepID=UPI00324B2DAD